MMYIWELWGICIVLYLAFFVGSYFYVRYKLNSHCDDVILKNIVSTIEERGGVASFSTICRRVNIKGSVAREALDILIRKNIVVPYPESNKYIQLVQTEDFEKIFEKQEQSIITSQNINYNIIDYNTNDQLILSNKEQNKECKEKEKLRIRDEILRQEELKKLRKQVREELIAEGLIENTKRREPIPQHVQDTVWRRDGGRCVKCGSQENLEFDHIIPLSKGGSNTVRNIQLLCQKCNREKSNKIG